MTWWYTMICQTNKQTYSRLIIKNAEYYKRLDTGSMHYIVSTKTCWTLSYRNCYIATHKMANNAVTRKHYNQGGTQIKGQFLWHREISSRKFLTLQRYRGKVSMHLRVYTLDDQNYCLIPTKKGVTLDKQQTRDLLENMRNMAAFIGIVSILV